MGASATLTALAFGIVLTTALGIWPDEAIQRTEQHRRTRSADSQCVEPPLIGYTSHATPVLLKVSSYLFRLIGRTHFRQASHVDDFHGRHRSH